MAASGKQERGFTPFEYNVRTDIEIAATTGMFPPDNPLDFYPTPDALVHALLHEQELLEMPSFLPDDERGPLRVLEPSAGKGAFIDGVMELYRHEARDTWDALRFTAVECDPRHAAYLRKKYEGGIVDVVESDFLTTDIEQVYHRVVMNPPFTAEKNGSVYIDHILRAFNLALLPGGILLAVTPNGWPTNASRKEREFREFVERYGEIIPNEEKAFKSSGTGVRTVTIKLNKPEKTVSA